MSNNKETEELSAINKYLTASGKTHFSYKSNPDDPPDVILSFKEKCIGCEVTEFFTDYSKEEGSLLKESESKINNIHKKIKSKIQHYQPRGLRININYKSTIPKGVNLEDESQRAFQSIINKFEEDFFEEDFIEKPTECINSVFIDKINGSNTTTNLGIWSNYIYPSKEIVNQIVKTKAKDIINWENSFDERWLVISFGSSMAGQVSIRDIKNINDIKLLEWDKIIFIDLGISDYFEINNDNLQ